jgi:hypothetical protein
VTRPWLAGDDAPLNTERVQRRAREFARLVFGDRYGVVLFLATLAFVATYWRIGIFITDSYAIANALVNVADGHLAVTEITYSITLGSQPGLWYSNGAVYGRNYAHVFASLPVLWVLQGLTALFDPRLVLVAGYTGLVFGTFDQLGRLTDQHRRFALVGGLVAVVFFAWNAAVAPPLDEKWLAFAALQITAMLATAFVGVVLYRLLAHVHGRRLGLLVGFAVVVASPVGFWASLPKRHVFSSLAVVSVLAAFYFARVADSERRRTGFRALCYVCIALLAWLHALEALVIFAAFVPVDLATSPSRRPKHLAVVGVVFLVALSPFLLTNLAITGSPLEPPRSLDPFSGQVDPLASDPSGGGTPTATPGQQTPAGTNATNATTAPGTATSTPSAGATPPPGGDGDSSDAPGPIATFLSTLVALAGAVVSGTLWALGRGWSFIDTGITVLLSDHERLYYTFVRSGRIPVGVDYAINQQEAVDLALLEVAPLLAGLLGLVGAAGRRIHHVSTPRTIVRSLASPIRQTDILATVMTLAFVLANLERLPLHAQLTVRYLVPIFPLGLYGVARLEAVQRVARTDWRWLVGPFLAVAGIAGAGLLLAHARFGLAIGEAMQLHALLALVSGAMLGGWALIAGVRPDTDPRLGAVALSIPAALTTLFLLFSGLLYFQYAEYAVPVAGTITAGLPF